MLAELQDDWNHGGGEGNVVDQRGEERRQNDQNQYGDDQPIGLVARSNKCGHKIANIFEQAKLLNALHEYKQAGKKQQSAFKTFVRLIMAIFINFPDTSMKIFLKS